METFVFSGLFRTWFSIVTSRGWRCLFLEALLMLIGLPAQGLVVSWPGLPHRQAMVSLAHVVCAFSPLSEDCCCFSVSSRKGLCLDFSGFVCLCVFAFLSGEYICPLPFCIGVFVDTELRYSMTVIMTNSSFYCSPRNADYFEKA